MKTATRVPLIVGESNPHDPRGYDPDNALMPWPRGASGDRLRGILGLTDGEYLTRFDRVNLVSGEWSTRAARSSAILLLRGAALLGGRHFVLLGRRVVEAFRIGDVPPFERRSTTWPVSMYTNEGKTGALFDVTYYVLPHPSGRCREWDEPRAIDRARALLAEFLPGQTPRPTVVPK